MAPPIKKIQELILCGCGCGETLLRYYEKPEGATGGRLGRERRYILGHSGKTDLARQRSSDRHRGERNVNWKGGISRERDRLKASLEYKAWAQAVYERDRFTCQLCGNRASRPEAHHIKPVRDYPDLVLVVSNGATLCGSCHEMTYGKESEFEDLLTARVANGVNSGNALPGHAGGNPEPSQSGNALEGVTTRGRGCPTDLSRFQKQEVPCAQCGQRLLRHPHRVKAQKRHFCSPNCKGEWQRTGYKGQGSTKIAVHCGWCGAELLRQPYRVNSYRVQYCGMQCMGKAWADKRWNAGNAPTSAPPERDEIV